MLLALLPDTSTNKQLRDEKVLLIYIDVGQHFAV